MVRSATQRSVQIRGAWLGKGRQKVHVVSLAMSAEEEDVPEELEEQCTKCHVALAGIEQLLQSVMSVSRTQMEEKVSF